MLNRQIHSYSEDAHSLQPTKSNQNLNQYYGSQDSGRILLDVPSETLTGITSYLDPPSLLALSRVNTHLYEHIKNDNTWHRAFVCQFLQIGPESDINDSVKSLMLRRSESSWRNEFIARYNLRRRWQKSRNTTITHVPVHSEVSSMHIMPSHSLLTSSIQYGVVSRSFPLTGKILSGYLDASGTRMGLGVGNPNAEFTPNVSACALTSDGGTAKVLWGFRNGEVAVMTASRAMDVTRRTGADLVRCSVDEQHEGAVLDVAWDEGAMMVTASADGEVKVWDAKNVRRVWTSQKNPGALFHDGCVKVAAAICYGYVVGVMRSGEIAIWSGFNAQSLVDSSAPPIRELRTPRPTVSLQRSEDSHQEPDHNIAHLYTDLNASSITLLVAYQSDPYFYKLRFDDTRVIETTAFGDASFGPLSTIVPFFSPTSGFVIAGDHMGCVSVFDWSISFPNSESSVQPVRKFEAYEDGSAVTAIAWNNVTLITGSSRGVISIWDALTFERLRIFTSPMPRIRGRGVEDKAVRQILVGPEKEVLMVSVGDRVLAWRAGPAPKHGAGGVRGRHATGVGTKRKDRSFTSKYFQQIEMQQTISESKKLFEQESKHLHRANGRKKEQMARLESMGLDEAEAVEYVLMLSRDEAMQYSAGYENTTRSGGYQAEEGVFEGDFHDITSSRSVATTQPPHASSSSACAISDESPGKGQSVPRIPASNLKQRIKGFSKSRGGPVENRINTGNATTSGPPHFPPVNSSGIAMGADLNRRTRPSPSLGPRQAETPSSAIRPQSMSPGSTKSTWATSLGKSDANGSRSLSPRGNAWAGTSPPALRLGGGSSLGQRENTSVMEQDTDEDLRFAIELSIAEARSRGMDV